MRTAIASVRHIEGWQDVVIEFVEAATQGEALAALAGNPDVVIIEPALGSDPTSRGGVHVIWAAVARGIPVIVHTSQRLEDSIQSDLARHDIPMLTKAVDPVVLSELAVLRALKADKPVDPTYDAFVRLARLVRALPGRLADNLKQLAALALDDATVDHNGNKTAAAESLGTNRHYADRLRAWLPRPKHFLRAVDLASETRLRTIAKVSPPPPRVAQGE